MKHVQPKQPARNKGLTAEEALEATRFARNNALREVYAAALRLAPGDYCELKTPPAYAYSDKIEPFRRNVQAWLNKHIAENKVRDRRYSMSVSTYDPSKFRVICEAR